MLLPTLGNLPTPPSTLPPPHRTLPACPGCSQHPSCRCPLADRRRAAVRPLSLMEAPTQSPTQTAAPCTIITTNTHHPHPYLPGHLEGHTRPRFGPSIPPFITTWPPLSHSHHPTINPPHHHQALPDRRWGGTVRCIWHLNHRSTTPGPRTALLPGFGPWGWLRQAHPRGQSPNRAGGWCCQRPSE